MASRSLSRPGLPRDHRPDGDGIVDPAGAQRAGDAAGRLSRGQGRDEFRARHGVRSVGQHHRRTGQLLRRALDRRALPAALRQVRLPERSGAGPVGAVLRPTRRVQHLCGAALSRGAASHLDPRGASPDAAPQVHWLYGAGGVRVVHDLDGDWLRPGPERGGAAERGSAALRHLGDPGADSDRGDRRADLRPEAPLSRRRWIARGRVQGVGFRWYVWREAERLGLGGFARNLSDGTVEVVSQGPDEALDRLEQALRRGPSGARVDALDELEVPAELEVPNSFAIK